MLNTIINLILLQIIVVNLIDISGFIDHIKKWIWRKYIKIGEWHNLSLKPIDCSYCMYHHTAVIYLLITSQFSIVAYAIVLLLSFLTPVLYDFLIWIKDLLTAFINLLYKPIDK